MGGVVPGPAARSAAPTPPRADLEAIWPYVPGRHPAEIVRDYGVRDVLKLASNENPLGPSPRAVEAASRALAGAHVYPDSTARALKDALAERIGLGRDHIVVGNGSVECIDLVARAFLRPGDEAVVSFPSFPRFQIACQVIGAAARVVPQVEWAHDLPRLAEAVGERTRVLFLDNPCNPTGTFVPAGALSEFLDALPPELLVVLDRAYYEFVPADQRFDEDVERIRAGENLVVLRTFSKAHGLAGLRVGYALARPEIARALDRVREAFNTTSIGQAAALAALDDVEHVTRTVRLVEAERPRLTAALRDLGLEVVESWTNFVFADLGPRAPDVVEGLLRRGVAVRPMRGSGIVTRARISVGTAEQNARLLAALRETLLP